MELFMTPVFWWVGVVFFMVVLYFVLDFYYKQLMRIRKKELNPRFVKKWPALLVITLLVMMLFMPVKFSDKRTNAVILNSFDTKIQTHDIKQMKRNNEYGASDNEQEINNITGGGN